jgi:hypothetical protein
MLVQWVKNVHIQFTIAPLVLYYQLSWYWHSSLLLPVFQTITPLANYQYFAKALQEYPILGFHQPFRDLLIICLAVISFPDHLILAM